MKKNYSLLNILFSLLVMCCILPACHEPIEPEPEPDPLQDYHFDLWIALDRHGGMGRDVQTLVRSVDSLTAQAPIDFKGEGTEVNSIMTLEAIVKDEYYYQVPVSGDRFSKYTITDNKINVIQEQRFVNNTFTPRKYAHAWLNEKTLLIIAANGAADKIIWTKLNTDDMSIVAEGQLDDLPLPNGASLFTSAGIANYRKADNKIFYFYFGKTGGARGKQTSPFRVATIDAATMKVLTDEVNSAEADQMVGTAYGELLQRTSFVDEAGILYLGCFKGESAEEKSMLLRIMPGQNNFDPSYNGFPADGKLLSFEPLSSTKLLMYAREAGMGTGLDDYSHYYCVVDLQSCTHKKITCDGADIPYSGGRFSDRMTTFDGKAYFGVNPEDTNPCIYIYDMKTDKCVKGADIAEGYYFEQIRLVKNVK